jgi:hypothetical protein
VGVSAACYCSPENIGVIAVIIAELKFSNAKWQIFCAYLVIAAGDVTLEIDQKPSIV